MVPFLYLYFLMVTNAAKLNSFAWGCRPQCSSPDAPLDAPPADAPFDDPPVDAPSPNALPTDALDTFDFDLLDMPLHAPLDDPPIDAPPVDALDTSGAGSDNTFDSSTPALLRSERQRVPVRHSSPVSVITL
ncbi:hypothetical protein Salat_1546900 [Sesamum alatum]|uniref:Secreted protein n=1 Tax=Sesamum alatum TaxID=300844 RepID=A0AAE1YCL9_9LAMI|nr:hypothetical protein Salat_1546900 [Sesamum alatum]